MIDYRPLAGDASTSLLAANSRIVGWPMTAGMNNVALWVRRIDERKQKSQRRIE